MNPRFYEIAEANHVLQYPVSLDTLMRVGEKLELNKGKRVLELACGKGELLIQWAREFGILGVGVDSESAFIVHARERANILDIGTQINFVDDDPAEYPQPFHEFDVVVCMRVAWLASGLHHALEAMKPAMRSRKSRLFIGEPFWLERPPEHVLVEMSLEADTLRTLGEMLSVFDELGLELLDFMQSDATDWDRYESLHWQAVYDWILENPTDPDVDSLSVWNADNRRQYFTNGRRYIGWGIFVLGGA